ncbi:MAG: YitT family protein [Floccifex sp.]
MKQILKKLTKNKQIRFILSILMILSSSFLQVVVIKVFMNPCNLLTSGFTGVAILINKITQLFGIEFSTSLGILLLNIPAALLCFKSVSKRFVFLSCLQFTTTSLLLKILQFDPFFDDRMLNVLFGGFLYGMCSVLALKADGSTGGTDFIALYVSNKINRSIWDFVFVFNCTMLLIFGWLFGWIHAGYSIIFQLISTQTISRFYHRYAQVSIEITTRYPETIGLAFTRSFKHGMSIVKAYGAFSKQEYYLCKTVVSSYEESDVIHIIRSVDPDAIIHSYKINHFYGEFYLKPIE